MKKCRPEQAVIFLEDDIELFRLIPAVTEAMAYIALSNGNLVAAEHQLMLLEHNIAARSFDVSPYSVFFIYSPTALYRSGGVYEQFGYREHAIDAYEAALDRWRQTGATFRL